MSPLLPRPSICGLQAALSSCRISTAPSSSNTAAAAAAVSSSWRAFTTTSSSQQRIKPRSIPVPPESPKFIILPTPPQSAEHKLPPIRGHLPVPRTVFTKKDGARKAKKAFVQNATPKSNAQLANLPPKSLQESRRRALAAIRRRNLAEGIQGLYVRKNLADSKTRRRGQHNARLHAEARARPERPDNYLNRGTVRAATATDVSTKPDEARFRRALASRDRTTHQHKVKAEARRDAIAQLYVAAQSFIVDDDELVSVVEDEFRTDTFEKGSKASASSPWSKSLPPSVADLQMSADGVVPHNTLVGTYKSSSNNKTTQRQKLVAEELTGGKLGRGTGRAPTVENN
ncbi:hypothetical protein QBC35DRAFT_458325 [Podospora australis]|uniref:Uncharacterized protein n=1 Tax=Podospora australis TaxID=1536484 RepID=A0AAN7AP41_9PEZI|nr:hypothetical protein QBC35DRAFT_458325 [Podospora australis]